MTRTPRKPRGHRVAPPHIVNKPVGGFGNKGPTPKQKHIEHLKHVEAGKDAAATRRARIAKYKRTHHGHAPPMKHRKLSLRHACDFMVSGFWLLGENDITDCCVAVAIANSLLYSTGYRVDDDALIRFCRALPNVSIAQGLNYLATVGLEGYRAPGRLIDTIEPGAILGVELQRSQLYQSVWDHDPSEWYGSHAVTAGDQSVITWSNEIQVTEQFTRRQVEEAWLVEWERA